MYTPHTEYSFDLVSGARGAAPSAKRVMLVGAKTSAGALAVNTPRQLLDEAEADQQLGKGSEAALMVRAAMRAARFYASKFGGDPLVQMPEFWAIVALDPGGAVKATFTLTVTVTTAGAGTLSIVIAGRRILVPVAAGDAQNAIAAAIKSEVDKLIADLPVTAGVAANVVTLTAVNGGVNGNDVRAPTVETTQLSPTGVTVASAAGVAGTGVFDAGALMDLLVDKRYHQLALANHAAADITDAKTFVDARWAPTVKQWSFVHLGEYGSISTCTTLSASANYGQILLHACRDIGVMPGELAAAIAATRACEGRLQRSFNGVPTTFEPPPVASRYSPAEIETLLQNGVSPLKATFEGDRLEIVRLHTTKTTESSVPYDALRDQSVLERTAQIAEDVDQEVFARFRQANRDDQVLKDIRSGVLAYLRRREGDGWLHHVDDHLDELLVTKTGTDGVRVAVPTSVVPHLHHLFGENTLFLE